MSGIEFNNRFPDIHNKITQTPNIVADMHSFACSNRFISENLFYTDSTSGNYVVFCKECGNPLFMISKADNNLILLG